MTDTQSALDRFREVMANIDPLADTLLKGHLLIEEVLSRIIEYHVFHSEHLQDARLTFAQKVALSRAFCLRKNQLEEWELILAINSLRNDFAHNLHSDQRAKKTDRVKQLFLKASDTARAHAGKWSEEALVGMSCAHCIGFLKSFEQDARHLREHIHALDRQMNPDKPEFKL